MMNRLDASRSNIGPLRDLLGLSPNPAWRPYLMGSVAATPDCLERAYQLVEDGAEIVNVVGVAEAQVAQAVAAIAKLPGIVVSADADRAAIAQVALESGARLVNDLAAGADPQIAELTRLANAARVALWEGEDQKFEPTDVLILDPSRGFTHTPAESIAAIRRLPEIAEPGVPLLLAIDRMDFIGGLIDGDPLDREAGSLAALSAGIDAGVAFVRTHDVAGTADYLTVRAALNGQLEVDSALVLAENKRRVDEGRNS